MFNWFKKRKDRIRFLERDIAILERELDEKEYFYDLGRKAAQASLNGYAMVDKKFLPKGKNCCIVMGHGCQQAADKLKIADKQWGRAFKHEGRIFMSKMRYEHFKSAPSQQEKK